MERSTIFHGKIHYNMAIFHCYVSSPEGIYQGPLVSELENPCMFTIVYKPLFFQPVGLNILGMGFSPSRKLMALFLLVLYAQIQNDYLEGGV